MSDSEEDFMSDKFITSIVKEDIRPGLIFNKGEKRKHEVLKKKQVIGLKKPKKYQEQENELREKGLGTAISSDNKGFQMLAKMGYTAGSSLGKQADGLKEPINITLKTNTSGIGLETRHKKSNQKKQQLKSKDLEHIEQKFHESRFEKMQQLFLVKDYHKSQRICEELDFRDKVTIPVEPYYWTKDTIKNMSDSNDSAEDDEPEEITVEKLSDIIMYLRDKYLYCIYCAITGESKKDLESNCPGFFREDHADIY